VSVARLAVFARETKQGFSGQRGLMYTPAMNERIPSPERPDPTPREYELVFQIGQRSREFVAQSPFRAFGFRLEGPSLGALVNGIWIGLESQLVEDLYPFPIDLLASPGVSLAFSIAEPGASFRVELARPAERAFKLIVLGQEVKRK
jgi:hypothetical protein